MSAHEASVSRFACLPWYDLPETRTAQDALWTVIARHMRRHGLSDVPRRLLRERPTLQMLTDPRLLLGQCCGYDVVYGFSGSVVPLATPEFDADGCEGSDYRSFVLVRQDSLADDLADLRGKTCVINGFNSHSGTNTLRALVAPLSRKGRFFGTVKVSGAHIASLAMLTAGQADVMAMDCVIHALLTRHRPAALAGTRILCRSMAAPAPPFVTAARATDETMETLRAGLSDAFADPDAQSSMEAMLLRGAAVRPLTDYARIAEIEASATARGYFELHATSAALVSAKQTA